MTRPIYPYRNANEADHRRSLSDRVTLCRLAFRVSWLYITKFPPPPRFTYDKYSKFSTSQGHIGSPNRCTICFARAASKNPP